MSAKEIAVLEERMRPGRSSTGGFLSHGQSLVAVVEQDTQTLVRLGLTHERLANRLRYLHLASRKFESTGAPILGRFEVEVVHFCGRQWCPFMPAPSRGGRLPCGYGWTEFRVTNLASGEFVYVTGLHPHLIGDHRFFEGGPYRLDPEHAQRVLELAPHEDDLIRWTTRVEKPTSWSWSASCLAWDGALWQQANVRKCLDEGKRLEFAAGFEAHVLGDRVFLCARELVSPRADFVIDGLPLYLDVLCGGAVYERRTREVEEPDLAQIERLTRKFAVDSHTHGSPYARPFRPPWETDPESSSDDLA